MRKLMLLGLAALLSASLGCSGEPAPNASEQAMSEDAPAETIVETTDDAVAGGWSAGDTIPSGMAGVQDIRILEVHANGSGEVCGSGRTASLKYKAMHADGKVIDPGRTPFSFRVGAGRAIKGWDVVVSKMRIGDSFTIFMPKELAYGDKEGDLKFDMELLTVQ